MSFKPPVVLIRRTTPTGRVFASVLHGAWPNEPVGGLLEAIPVTEEDAKRPLQEIETLLIAGKLQRRAT